MSNKKLLSDSFWALGSHLLSLCLVFFSNILLARLMSPQEFGELGIIMFFVLLFNVFAEGGLGGALIRKLNKNDNDYSTVFTFNFLVSLFLFLVVIIISKPVSDYYNSPAIRYPLIASASILVISSFQIVQNIKLTSELKFKLKGIITVISSFLGVIIGLLLAFVFKVGVWSLISIPITTIIFQTLISICFEGFYFKLHFDRKSFKELYSFGINTTLATLLNLIFDNIYQLVMGKMFSVKQVGYFYQAKKLQDVPNLIVANLSQGVFFSTLSKIQSNEKEVVNKFRLISSFFLSIMGLLVLIIWVSGTDIIYLLLGEKWLTSVYYIKLLIIGSLFYTQELINRMIFKIFNKTAILLKLEIVKKSVQALTLMIGIYYQRVDLLLYGYILTNMFSYFLNYYATNRIIQIGKVELFVLLKVSLVVVCLYFINLYIVNNFIDSLLGRCIINSLIFLIYIALSYLLKIVNLKLFFTTK